MRALAEPISFGPLAPSAQGAPPTSSPLGVESVVGACAALRWFLLLSTTFLHRFHRLVRQLTSSSHRLTPAVHVSESDPSSSVQGCPADKGRATQPRQVGLVQACPHRASDSSDSESVNVGGPSSRSSSLSALNILCTLVPLSPRAGALGLPASFDVGLFSLVVRVHNGIKAPAGQGLRFAAAWELFLGHSRA